MQKSDPRREQTAWTGLEMRGERRGCPLAVEPWLIMPKCTEWKHLAQHQKSHLQTRAELVSFVISWTAMEQILTGDLSPRSIFHLQCVRTRVPVRSCSVMNWQKPWTRSIFQPAGNTSGKESSGWVVVLRAQLFTESLGQHLNSSAFVTLQCEVSLGLLLCLVQTSCYC